MHVKMNATLTDFRNQRLRITQESDPANFAKYLEESWAAEDDDVKMLAFLVYPGGFLVEEKIDRLTPKGAVTSRDCPVMWGPAYYEITLDRSTYQAPVNPDAHQPTARPMTLGQIEAKVFRWVMEECGFLGDAHDMAHRVLRIWDGEIPEMILQIVEDGFTPLQSKEYFGEVFPSPCLLHETREHLYAHYAAWHEEVHGETYGWMAFRGPLE